MKYLLFAMMLMATSAAAVDDAVEKRIERVVNSLLPDSPFRNKFEPAASLKKRMAYFHTPGVSIAVVNDYRIEWARGFGVKEWGKPAPVTEETMFQAGSVSKPTFALAVMRLEQDGRLDLERDVNDYLKSWKMPANDSWQPHVTLRQLLSHTAGTTVHGFPGYLRTDKIPTLPQLLRGEPPANTPAVLVNMMPGTELRYSGGGTTVAQLMVTEHIGKAFPEIMREVLFERVGMKQSTYEQPLPKRWHKYAATGHPSDYRAIVGGWHVYPEMAAAGLWTTPSDLARAGLDLQLALKGETNRLLKPKQAERMLTPGINDAIGVGYFLAGKGHTQRFTHGGWDEGFVTQMTMYREDGKGAVVMVNSNEGNPLLGEIERAIAREYRWPDYFPEEKKTISLDAKLAEAYAGDYSGRGLKFTLLNEGGKVFLKANGQQPLELRAESATHFFSEVLNLEITIKRDADHGVKGFTCEQDGRKIEFKRSDS
ncbi:MAG TPA: serine hydrolase domain-containing protein [Verrucomicrobiae bacterium]|nr:serine hydrolase domain-containing protein [Verrucomicrobiae bacterium]